MGVTHTFVSGIADDPAAAAAGQVLPSHWNATHTVNVNLASEVSGVLPVANGGSGTATPTLSAGSNVAVTGSWPSQTVAFSGILPVTNGGSGTATPSLVAGTNITVSGTWPNQTVAASGSSPSGSTTQLQYNNAGAFGGASGLTTNGTELTIASGTKTADAPLLNATQTWNNAATTFTGIKLNVTNTASATASLLADLQVNGASILSVRKDNSILFFGGGNSGELYSTASTLNFSSSSPKINIQGTDKVSRIAVWDTGLLIASAGTITWSSNINGPVNTNLDLYLSRKAAASLQLGAADAAAPVAQTIGPQSVVAGTSNTAGANFTIRGSQSTGTGAGGDIIFQVASAGSTGTAQNALATAMRVYNTKTVAVGSAFTVATLPAAGTQGRRAWVTDALAPTFLGALTGGGAVICPVFDNGTAWVAG